MEKQKNTRQPDYDYALQALQERDIRQSEEFRQWLKEPDNKQLFRHLLALREAAAREQAARQRQQAVRRRLFVRIGAVAATVALLIGIASLWRWQTADRIGPNDGTGLFFASLPDEGSEVVLQSERNERVVVKDTALDVRRQTLLTADAGETLTVSVPRGKDFKLTLADGTRVWLNAGSSLRYPSRFTERERSVELQGEAFFEVARDERHPFIVRTGEVVTQVLGTQFNFRAYPGETTHVTLVSGSVKVTGKQGRSTVLQPGQDLSHDSDGHEAVQEVNTDCFTAWTEGYFYFEEAPLEEIMRTLGRWYNVSVVFDTSEARTQCFNLWTEREATLEQTIDLINRMQKVSIAQDGNGTVRVK